MAHGTAKFYDRADVRWAHPELEELYARLCYAPPADPADTILNIDIPFEQRCQIMEMQQQAIAAYLPTPDLSQRTTYWADGCEEEPDAPKVEVAVVRPEGAKKKNGPCVICLPGGGLYSCLLEYTPLEGLAKRCNAVVVGFRYRSLYTGGGYPQTVNDCHAVFNWVLTNADDLGIDPNKIVIFGQSSGSQLVLAMCHRLKKYDYYGHEPRGCVVMATIVDERLVYPSSNLKNWSWDGDDLYHTSKMWLGRKTLPSDVPAEAFPNHATPEDCIGLPPTFIHSEESDASTDPAAQYASKLVQAGVYTEFHLWGGTNHGVLSYDPDALDTDYLRRFGDVMFGNITDCLKYDLRRTWLKEQ